MNWVYLDKYRTSSDRSDLIRRGARVRACVHACVCGFLSLFPRRSDLVSTAAATCREGPQKPCWHV